MARRPRLNLTGTIDTERHAQALDRHLRRMTGPARQPEEAPADSPDPRGVGGAGGGATGFGRRAVDTDYERVHWDPDVPYPQEEPARTSNIDRPRTVASGYDPGNQILRVTFREGATYEYLDVPSHTWETYRRAPSPGRMIDDVLNQFFYRRID